MRKTVEIVGLLLPLAMSGLFLISALVLPFGGLADQADDTLLLAFTLIISSIAVGVHLLWRISATSIAGVLANGVALLEATYLYVKLQHFGSFGYGQVVFALILSAIACGWHLKDYRMARTDLF